MAFLRRVELCKQDARLDGVAKEPLLQQATPPKQARHHRAETKTCEHTGDGAYLCDFFEVEGTFVVTATRGDDSDSATVEVGADECHVIAETVEFVLPATA